MRLFGVLVGIVGVVIGWNAYRAFAWAADLDELAGSSQAVADNADRAGTIRRDGAERTPRERADGGRRMAAEQRDYAWRLTAAAGAVIAVGGVIYGYGVMIDRLRRRAATPAVQSPPPGAMPP